MDRHNVNTFTVLLAALIVLASAVIFSQACGDLVAEIRLSRQVATEKADAATLEAHRLNEFLARLVRLGEE